MSCPFVVGNLQSTRNAKSSLRCQRPLTGMTILRARRPLGKFQRDKSRQVGWSQWVNATPSKIEPVLKGGVYGSRETMAKHKTFTVATNVKVYFCDPHSPWQRGTKTPTACCDNTCRREPTYPATRNLNWTRSRYVSINAREKLWASRRQRVNYAQILRQPSEPARLFRT